MIIPRHRVCDICGEEVGCNKRYFIIKSKDRIYDDVFYSDNRRHEICEDCMERLKRKIFEELMDETVSSERNSCAEKLTEVRNE